MLKNTAQRYGSVAQGFHWLVVVAFIVLFVMAEVMGDLPKDGSAMGLSKWELYGLHKSIGFTLLAVVLARLLWRFMNITPAFPTMPKWQVAAAYGVHVLLYVAMFAMPISGYIMSQAGGHGLNWFGVWDVPNVLGVNKPLAGIAHEVHEIAPTVIYILVGVHVVAAVYHHFVMKDNVLTRMLPWAKQ